MVYCCIGRERAGANFPTMTVFAVEGVAGSGKTFRLIENLSQTLADNPLGDGERILALTFMHGARRRLNQKLLGVTGLRGRFECMTIDSFAWRLVRRWRGLATAIGLSSIREDQYDEQCDAAGALLERSEVCNWIAASFPVVLIDEAQDLKPQRLRIVCALARSSTTLIAADEYRQRGPPIILLPIPQSRRSLAHAHETP